MEKRKYEIITFFHTGKVSNHISEGEFNSLKEALMRLKELEFSSPYPDGEEKIFYPPIGKLLVERWRRWKDFCYEEEKVLYSSSGRIIAIRWIERRETK